MADLTPAPGLPRLSDHWRFVRRHQRLLGLLTGVGLLVGVAMSLSQPTAYSATASVSLVPVPVYVTPATVGLVPPEVTIDTDAQLLLNPKVLGAVADVLDIKVSQAQEHMSVTASPSSHVLHVTVSGGSPDEAARAAEAAVDAFVDVRRDSLGSLTHKQLRQLRLFVESQKALLAKEQAKRMVITGADEMFQQTLDLRDGLDELEEARRVPAQIIGPAQPAQAPDHANSEVPITSGAMVGLLTGWLLSAGRDTLRRTQDDTKRTEDDHDDLAE